jgi:hypothetical protein
VTKKISKKSAKRKLIAEKIFKPKSQRKKTRLQNIVKANIEAQNSTAPTTRKSSKESELLSEISPILSPTNTQTKNFQKISDTQIFNLNLNLNSELLPAAKPKTPQHILQAASFLLKSRSINSIAGSLCSKLQNGIENMNGKAEEKKQKYFKRVEELRNKKIDSFLDF